MIIPEGYAQLNIAFAGQAQPNGAQITMGLTLPVGATITDVMDSVESVIVASAFKDFVDNESKVDYFLVKFGPNDIGPSAIRNLDITGDMGGDGLVPSVAVLARKITALGGRAGHGRLYWPFVGASMVDDGGNFTGSWREAFETMLNDFKDDLSSTELPMTLLHGEGSPIETPLIVSSLSVQSKVATQRRRLRK